MALLVTEAKNIADAFYKQAAATPKAPVYSQAIANGDDYCSEQARQWKPATFESVQSNVCALAQYLQSIRVEQGTSVAIISASRPEWMLADLAILSCGGVSVSVYQSLPADDIGYILFDSGSQIFFAENQEQVDKLLGLIGTLQDIPGTEDRQAQQASINVKKIISFESVDPHELVVELATILKDNSTDVIPEAVASIELSDTASLVYTSGTTGPPKGVIQTHGNHLANVRQAYESKMLEERNSLSLFLPLAHAFAKLMGYLGYLTPAQLRFPAIIDTRTSKLIPQSVSKDIREGSAHIVPLVPRLLEKMKEGVQLKTRGGGIQGTLLKLTVEAAQNRYNALKQGKSPSPKDALLYALTTPLRKKIKKALFGPNFEFCVSGGAKLAITVAEFFDALDIIVIEGYGLTETCVATNVGRVANNKIGSVGPVLSDDIQLKILDDGEVIFKGPNIAKGYHGRPTATKASWDEDGWFHTGDLGELDENNYLSIIGRKKEMIITSGGKNIAPHDIETEIKEHPLVSQVVLIGDGRKYCVALLSVIEDEAKKWLEKAGKLEQNVAINEQPALKEYVWKHISDLNKTLASFETVKKIYITPEDFTVENGLLTPTFKAKRAAIEKLYSSEIDALY